MPKSKTQEPTPFASTTLKAVAVWRINHLCSEAVELSIENGVLTDIKRITRAPDQHGTAIGQAQGRLWQQSRENAAHPIPVSVSELSDE